jgi:hypothetical protein
MMTTIDDQDLESVRGGFSFKAIGPYLLQGLISGGAQGLKSLFGGLIDGGAQGLLAQLGMTGPQQGQQGDAQQAAPQEEQQSEE